MSVGEPITHWSEISQNPNDPEVSAWIRRQLEAKRGRIASTSDFLVEFVGHRSVLDIGVVQHHMEKTELAAWKHALIKRASAKAVGVDILDAEVAELNRRGFDVRLVDATSDVDLGERFERVFIGDVIEHVDNPVALLRFAGRHLASSGLVLVVTPNPVFIGHLWAGFRRPPFIPNADHVSWISPPMALELGHRAGLPLRRYWHTQGEGTTIGRKAAVGLLKALRLRDREMFSGMFYYLFGAADDRH